MSTEIRPWAHHEPEAQEEALAAEVVAVREVVLTLERELASLQAELHEFRAARAHVLAHLYAELDRADAQVAAELLRRRPGDEVLRGRAHDTQARAAQSRGHAEALRQPPPPRPPATRSLQAAYHAAARRFHPDVGREGDETSRHRFMVLLNEAYARRDEQGIELLLDDWTAQVVRVPLPGPDERLAHGRRVLARLRATQARLAAELHALRESPEHALLLAVQREGPSGLTRLDQLIVELTTRIQVTQERLAALRGAGGRDA